VCRGSLSVVLVCIWVENKQTNKTNKQTNEGWEITRKEVQTGNKRKQEKIETMELDENLHL
jgi:ABC-type protease/lipase transport system fused ATPase/permease subunit